jgi:MFS family permease
VRDTPRDAFLADLTIPQVRATGFGLRLALAFAGFVLGPLAAVGFMTWSGDDFRLVFWIALIPAYLSILLLLVSVKEVPGPRDGGKKRRLRRSDVVALPAELWWVIAIAGLFSLARFSSAFLILKALEFGIDTTLVPLMLLVMYLVYSVTAYPCGVLADHFDRRIQLVIGAIILIGADVVLATANTVWLIVLGTGLWGLQLGVTQGLLGATVADIAAIEMRGTAFGLYDIAIGITAFAASAGAGLLWTGGGSAAVFGIGALVAAAAALMLILQPLTLGPNASSSKPC